MMLATILAAALVAVTLAAFWTLDRKDERHRIERATLINHIQLGERVPTRPALASEPRRDAVEPFDDEDQYALVGTIQPPAEG